MAEEMAPAFRNIWKHEGDTNTYAILSDGKPSRRAPGAPGAPGAPCKGPDQNLGSRAISITKPPNPLRKISKDP